MGTCNFAYANRCVVVSNEDLEFGNCPKLSKYLSESLYSYPSYELDDYIGDFKYYLIVLTGGYYENACIDFIESDYHLANDYSLWEYKSVNELLEDLTPFVEGRISKTKLQRIFSGVKKWEGDLEEFLISKLNEVDEILKAIERDLVNDTINQIKADYGYEEYGVAAKFPNGETWYTRTN